jgi:cytochrome c oxidase assembly protein subunit 11
MKSQNNNNLPNGQGKSDVKNTRVAIICVATVCCMVGLAYAAVPLYQIFCQVTGYGGTTQRVVEAPSETSKLTIKVRFDANIDKDLDWKFYPKQREVTVHLGEKKTISYGSINLSDKELTGTATFNVTPQAAGVYFNKIECFCFTETTLKPGDSLDMPVVFFIDPDIVDDEIMHNLGTITLSYTFFETEKTEEEVSSAQ